MYRANEMRRSEEAFGAPQRIVEICAVTFQLRRKSTVDNGDAAEVTEEICQQRRHVDNVDNLLLRVMTNEIRMAFSLQIQIQKKYYYCDNQ